jgi:hypothetical protein
MILYDTETVVLFGWELCDDFIQDLSNHVDRWNQAGVKRAKKRKGTVRLGLATGFNLVRCLITAVFSRQARHPKRTTTQRQEF